MRFVCRLLSLLVILIGVSADAWAGMGTRLTTELTDFTVELIASGVALQFSRPVAIDEIQVPVNDSRVWGEGNRGRVVSVRSASSSAVGTAWEDEERILVSLRDEGTDRLEVFPVWSEPSSRRASLPRSVSARRMGNRYALLKA
mgnify:CR=1 FL=1